MANGPHGADGPGSSSQGAYRTVSHVDPHPDEAGDSRRILTCAREASFVSAIAALEKKNQQLEDDLAAALAEIARLRGAQLTE